MLNTDRLSDAYQIVDSLLAFFGHCVRGWAGRVACYVEKSKCHLLVRTINEIKMMIRRSMSMII